MTSGGTRAHSGPAPDPNALRRDRASDQAGWATLPSSGRQEPAPAWPLVRATKRELVLWAREWSRPQAVMWEANGQFEEVALYVRSLAAAERTSATVAARTLVRQQQEALGISLPGLARLRWRIADPGAPAAAKATGTDGPSAKDRWRVIDGGS